jgi:methyl-accepting chemotaxis protein
LNILNNIIIFAEITIVIVSFVDELVSDFSSTSQELLASIESITSVIESISKVSGDGAIGISDISSKVGISNTKANDVKEKVLLNKASVEKLKDETDNFKL